MLFKWCVSTNAASRSAQSRSIFLEPLYRVKPLRKSEKQKRDVISELDLGETLVNTHRKTRTWKHTKPAGRAELLSCRLKAFMEIYTKNNYKLNICFYNLHLAEAKVVRIVSLPNQRFQSVNSFVMLTCLASEGVPSPRVAIYRQDAMLATGQQTVSVVYKLKESDNKGTFSCKSTTEGIKGWKSSNIIVFHVLGWYYTPTYTYAISPSDSASH